MAPFSPRFRHDDDTPRFWDSRDVNRWVLIAVTLMTGISLGLASVYEIYLLRASSPQLWIIIGCCLLFIITLWIRVSYAIIAGYAVLMFLPALAGPLVFAFTVPVISALAALACSLILRRLTLFFLILWSILASSIWHSTLPAPLLSTALSLVVVLGYATGSSFRFLETERTQSLAKIARLQAERDQAIASERESLARDLHDVVAHDITLIAMHSRAAQLKDTPEGYREAVSVAAESAQEALADLRRLLKVLTSSSALLQHTSLGDAAVERDTPEDILALAGRLRSLGFTVHTSCTAETAALPQSLKLAIFRMLQECVTNIAKHGEPRGRCWIDLSEDAQGLILSVRNTLGSRIPADEVAQGTSQGLRGIQDRAKAFGGQVRFGPCDQTGWEVVISQLHVT